MGNELVKKGLVLSIILLFVGASVIPTISSETEKKSNNMEVLYQNEPPTITITEPDDKWARGHQSIEGTAHDPDGSIELVQVAIAPVGIDPPDEDYENATGTTSWSYQWNTFNYTEYFINWTIWARAIDNEGEEGGDHKTVEVDNTPPLLTFIKPIHKTLTFFNKIRIYLGIFGIHKTYVIGPIFGVTVQVDAIDPHHGRYGINDSSMIFHWGDSHGTLTFSSFSACWEYKWDVFRIGKYFISAEGCDRAGNKGFPTPKSFEVFYFNI